jgi:hypothetical protein
MRISTDTAITPLGGEIMRVINTPNIAADFMTSSADQLVQSLATGAIKGTILAVKAQPGYKLGSTYGISGGSGSQIGDVRVAQGDLPGALKAYKAALAIQDRIYDRWRHELCTVHAKSAMCSSPRVIFRVRPKLMKPRTTFLDQFVKKNPGNVGWRRDLSVSQNKIGDVLVAQGNLPEALAAYWASLDIRERLAKAEASGEGGPRQRWTAARPFRLAGEDR